MTTLVSDLIDSTKQHLLGSYRAEYNFLTAGISPTDLTLTLDLSLVGVGRGSILALGTELIYVKSVTGQVCTISRGWLGTVAATHNTGDTIEINPRFPRQDILNVLQAEIASWGSAVYYVDTITLSANSRYRGYDLTALGDFYSIIDVRRAPYTAADQSNTWPSVRTFEVVRNLPAATFPSTNALFLGAGITSSTSLQVTVAKPFDTSTFTESTNVVSTCKLGTNLLDIPPYGAAWRLLSTREIKRTFNDSQPEARVSAEVPPGYTDQTAARLKKIRDDRLNDEAARLRSKTPLRF